MTTVVATHIMVHRGKNRIWLQGPRLQRAGFEMGQQYTGTMKKGALHLFVTPDGPTKVSGRKATKEPILDCKSDEVAKFFQPGEKIIAIMRKGRIIIKRMAQAFRNKSRVQRILGKLQLKQKLDVGCIFHGGGVMARSIHEGLAARGIRSRLGLVVEVDGRYVDASLRANANLFDSESLIINAPIQDVMIGKVPQLDLLHAGIPCTGASVSGMARCGNEYAESHEDAGAMFFYLMQWIQATNPAVIVLECVKQYLKTASMAVIRNLLKTWGYRISEAVLNGNDFGAFERRERMVVVAYSEELGDMMGEFKFEQLPVFHKKADALGELLDEVAFDSPDWHDHAYLVAKEQEDAKKGNSFKRQLFTEASQYIGTITRGYDKRRSTDCHILQKETGKTRLLSNNEHARVKQIPTDWVQKLGVAKGVAHQIMGQGVIWSKFMSVAGGIADWLKAGSIAVSNDDNIQDWMVA